MSKGIEIIKMRNSKGELVEVQEDSIKFSLGIGCLICHESMELTEMEREMLHYGKSLIKVCDKCRQAVMEMRSRV